MAEIHTDSKAKIPGHLAFPVNKSTIEEYLHSLPQKSFRLEFVRGREQKNDGHMTVLYGFYGDRMGWTIWIQAVPQALLQPIKAALVSDGLSVLRNWLARQASNTSNTRQSEYFRIDFDGQKLQFIDEREEIGKQR